MAAANADVGVATAELYPRIDLGGFLGFVALRGADFGNASSRAFSVSPGVSWPALHLPTALARKRAPRPAQRARSRVTSRPCCARWSWRPPLTGYGENQQRLGSLAQAAAQSGRAAELAQLRYKEGTTPYLTVLDAQRLAARPGRGGGSRDGLLYQPDRAVQGAGRRLAGAGRRGREGAQRGRPGRRNRDWRGGAAAAG